MAINDERTDANFIVGGYDFLSELDAQKASLDLSKIKVLEERVKASRPNDIKAVYEKAIENKIFKSPIGWQYLARLREKLYASGFSEEELIPIPIPVSLTRHSAFENLSVQQRIKPDSRDSKAEFKRLFPYILNIFLLIIVIAMFIIASTSDSDNILNYKRNVTNRYSSWEQDLTQREKVDDLKILVVDDESRMRKLVKDFLIKDGYIVIEAGDGQQALDIFYEDKEISLIILDVMMPNRDGWEVCREIRKNSKVPIIMLTAKSEERDELLGFELGVDEYISKPFSPKILAARVSAILRRANILTTNEVMEEGGITINKVAHSVTVDGKDIELSYKEFELLSFFFENKGVALSREKILNNVWNYDYFGDARTIDTHVKKLRGKLGNKGDMIKTIWGMGYKFETD